MSSRPDPAATSRLAPLLLKSVVLAHRAGLVRPSRYGRPFDAWPARLFGGLEVDVATRAGRMRLPLRDRGVRPLLVHGELPHERAEARLLRRLLPRLRGVVDVGANVGWYTRLAETHLPAGGRVLAIEPNPAVAHLLRHNARRAEVLQAAAGERPGSVTLYTCASSDLASTVRPVGPPVQVPVVPLDDVCAERAMPVDLVKCDVEGGEAAVLRGARQLRTARPRPIWLLEADPAFLREAGETPEALDDDLSGHLLFAAHRGRWSRLRSFTDVGGHVNVLAVPPERVPLVADLLPTS